MTERPLTPQNRLYRGFHLMDDRADYEPRNSVKPTKAEEAKIRKLANLAAWLTALVAAVSFALGLIIGSWGRA